MLWCPPWPELILNWARPLLAWTPSSDHPAGTEARQGTDVAEGTLGKTTIQSRIVPSSQDPGFRNLQLGPGEDYVVRGDQIGTAHAGRPPEEESTTASAPSAGVPTRR